MIRHKLILAIYERKGFLFILHSLPSEVFELKYLYALAALVVILSTASAAAGSFKPGIDVITYIDASNANMSFGDNDNLWVSSADGSPERETYLSFINDFTTARVSKPDMIQSATLKFDVSHVERPGKVTAYFVEGPTLDTLTWNDKPAYESSAAASLNVEQEGEYSMNVTPLIKKAIETCPGECGYSIVLISPDSASVEISKKAPEKPSLEYTTAE
jgi:hypothetical protein